MTDLTNILGAEFFGTKVKEWIDIDSLIRKGFSIKVLSKLKAKLQLTDTDFSNLLGVSQRTLNRQRTNKQKLSPVASDRLYRIAKIYALATEVLESEDKARGWLNRSQHGLGNRRPIDLLNTEVGTKEVENLLLRIEYGVYS